jgi:hypothetical protein
LILETYTEYNVRYHGLYIPSALAKVINEEVNDPSLPLMVVGSESFSIFITKKKLLPPSQNKCPTCQNCLSQNNCPMLFIALYFSILPLSLYSIMIKGDNKVTKESTF